VGSDNWYRAQTTRGAALFKARHYHEAEKVFADMLVHLGHPPSDRRCITLANLGRCYHHQHQTARAEAIYRQALAEAGRLEQTEGIRRLVGTLQADLSDALMLLGHYQDARAALEASMIARFEFDKMEDIRQVAANVQAYVGEAMMLAGRYPDARAAYETSLALNKEFGNDRGVAMSLEQLGNIALKEGNLKDAESRYLQAIETFRGLRERSSEAMAWHQLGNVNLGANRIDQAEHALRESARIKEDIGVGASDSWDALAQVMRK
jgi:pentatricopeptide repeat protein